MADAEKLAARIARHATIQSVVDGLTDDALVRWLAGSDALLRDGFATLSPPGSDVPVFVKLLPLTDLEREPAHRGSTANLFGLPPFYNYRLGGAGFGVQRELVTHEIAGAWASAAIRTEFPLLHAARELPIARPIVREPVWPNAWGTDSSVAARHAAVERSTHSVAVFLEHFPATLLQWLWDRPLDAPEVSSNIAGLESRLLRVVDWMNSQGLLHMDAHFENILTDEEDLYFTDFGLALSNGFELSEVELEFFTNHQDLDRITVITSLVHAVFTRHAGSDNWREALHTFITTDGRSLPALPAGARDYILRRGALWQAMKEFYGRLRADITAPFPAEELLSLLEKG